MDILSLRLFIRIADLKSISASARDLQLSPASASTRLAKLEEDLGFRLFNRTTRAVSLTTDGAAFLPFAQQTIEALEAGLHAINGQGADAQGRLRITMPGSFGRMYILPILHHFHERHPHVQLDLRLSDEVLDVIEGAYDLIIRNAALSDSSFVARKLASDTRLLVASPSYLARHGTPSTPAALAQHQCVVLSDNDKWSFESGETIQVPRSFVVNDGEAMRMMIENGLGIGAKSRWNVCKSLQSRKLVEILPHETLITNTSIWAIYPSNRAVPPKVRVMLDFLLEQFSPVPPWEQTTQAKEDKLSQ